jgi:Fur family iron response transcriptional regulator
MPHVSALLKARGITPTQQRLEIAQLLFARPQHLSAEQLLEQVNQGRMRVSKATIYNTLNLFSRKGLVREIIVDPTKVFYDSNLSRHHHFFNVDTGELTDVPPDGIGLDQLPEVPAGTVLEGVDVIIRIRAAEPAWR